MWNGRNKDVERLLKLRGQQCPFSDEVCTKVRRDPRTARSHGPMPSSLVITREKISGKVKISGSDANIKVFEENRTKQNRPIFQNGKSWFSNVKWGASSQIGPNDHRKDVTHFMILVKIFFR